MQYVESKSALYKIIGASSAGTLIEWYDFYIFGSLAAILATKFFPPQDELAAFLYTLGTFAAGFIVRPFGAIFFGYLGDLIGRKYTFLVTLLLMGGATFAIGLVPSYEVWGIWSGYIILALRLLQGLALGGEYGGAATYVAEHSPDGHRGYYTSWIQTTATLGLFVSLGIVLICRNLTTEAQFNDWGWRIPFLLSIFLVIFSYFLRLKMKESPLFVRMKKSGKGSKNPIKESFGNWYNLKFVLIALFGATAGQGVVWYTGQFYALTFMQKSLNVDFVQTNYIIGIALLIATPFFVMMGSLSDKIGRKPIILTGCVLAVIFYLPIFHGLSDQADLSKKTLVSEVAKGEAVVKLHEKADPALGVVAGDRTTATTSVLTYADGSVATRTVTAFAFADASRAATSKTAYKIRLGTGQMVICIALVATLVTFVTMVYGPIAAFLVEMFPTKIRYTSMSLPYHIGNGIFGGLVPLTATWMAAKAAQPGTWASGLAETVGGAKFVGLLYPMLIATITVIIGAIFIREKKNFVLHEDVTLDAPELASESSEKARIERAPVATSAPVPGFHFSNVKK
jgi:MHS family proline/betaine transporter-like MFS transporter